MDTAKLKQLLQKELNDRKIYEDALETVNALDGLVNFKKEVEKRTSDAEKECIAAEKKKAEILKENDALIESGKKIIDDAKSLAAKSVNEAKEKADKALKVSSDKIAKAEFDIKGLIEEAAIIRNTSTAAKAELDKLNAAIADAKSKFKSLIE